MLSIIFYLGIICPFLTIGFLSVLIRKLIKEDSDIAKWIFFTGLSFLFSLLGCAVFGSTLG